MDYEQATEYTETLGQIVGASWRQILLGERLGVPEALGLTTRDWVESRLGGYMRLAVPERREAVAELTEGGLSTREIGDVLGVAQSTVVRDKAEPNGSARPSDRKPRTADPEPNGSVHEPAAEPVADEPKLTDAQAWEKLDQIQPFAALKTEDIKYMVEFHKAHVRMGHVVTDLLKFDLERVVWLCDAADLNGLEEGLNLMREYERTIERARGGKDG